MICRVTGLLESVNQGKAVLVMDHGLAYEILVPTFVQARLGGLIDQPISLWTIHYLEGTSQGNSFTPRLAGFMDPLDRAFFELYTTVKGIGPRKALRSLAMNTPQIAMAIADRDAKMLQSLPEIGKRMAETIIATLHGKVDRFLDATAAAGPDDRANAPAMTEGNARIARDALEVLVQLGESRTDAMRWIDAVLAKYPDIDDANAMVQRVFEIRHQ